MSEAYGTSILLMMASPFVLLGLIGFLVYWSVKRAQRLQEPDPSAQ
ncbi:MAG: hypothetical protein ACYTGZ_22265 [Planctomycetota bacterium]|jgi:hypothetical protein